MKKFYDSYDEAIHQQVSDFIVVTDTEILPNGKICVTGEGFSSVDSEENIIDSLPFMSWLIDK